MVNQPQSIGMLSHISVLDLTDEKGAYCGQLLGCLGADVIKIEKPGGDQARNLGPFVRDIPRPEGSLFWLAFNTNKRGITLNIENKEGKEIFKRLVKKADVVIESYYPGYMEELGLGYSKLETVNPGIIVASITPYGQEGPYRDYKASDLDCWGMGGLLANTGCPNKPPSCISHIPASFLIASQDAALGIALALFWRNNSGCGQRVNVSIQESVVRTAWNIRENWLVTGKEVQRSYDGHQVPGAKATMRKIWQVKDGYISYVVFGGRQGSRQTPLLIKWMDEEGMADDQLKKISWANLDWGSLSQEEGEQIQEKFAKFFRNKTKTQLFEGAIARGIMLQPIYKPSEILDHPQLKAREYWQNVSYPSLDLTFRYPGRCFLPSDSLCKIWRPAPDIGEHNPEVYQELGYSKKELVILKQQGVI